MRNKIILFAPLMALFLGGCYTRFVEDDYDAYYNQRPKNETYESTQANDYDNSDGYSQAIDTSALSDFPQREIVNNYFYAGSYASPAWGNRYSTYWDFPTYRFYFGYNDYYWNDIYWPYYGSYYPVWNATWYDPWYHHSPYYWQHPYWGGGWNGPGKFNKPYRNPIRDNNSGRSVTGSRDRVLRDRTDRNLNRSGTTLQRPAANVRGDRAGSSPQSVSPNSSSTDRQRSTNVNRNRQNSGRVRDSSQGRQQRPSSRHSVRPEGRTRPSYQAPRPTATYSTPSRSTESPRQTEGRSQDRSERRRN